MIGACPECGFSGSISAFLADGALKEALAQALKLPREVQEQLVPYLGLFRPERRSLTGARTLRVVRELLELVATGRVDWEKSAPRPCPPRLWAEGMRQMAERKAGQRAHMTSHNYLRKLVYDLADKADSRREAGVRQAEKNHERPASQPPPLAGGGEGEGAETSEAARAFFSAVRDLSGKLGMPPTKSAATSGSSPGGQREARSCGRAGETDRQKGKES